MTRQRKINLEPQTIFREYESGKDYKSSIGDKGIYEQTKMNERFFVGDQWHGAKCGNEKPLVRRNVIKRIGEYKLSCVGSAPIAVNYSADGVPNTDELKEDTQAIKYGMMHGSVPPEGPNEAEISVITSAMSDYFRVTAERVKFDKAKDQLLRNAYISGTAICNTYWDESIQTGLYADESKTTPIKGDIAFEVLDVENVNFGDPNNDDVQSQPFIILSQRRDVDDVRREAKHNRISAEDIESIKPDGAESYNSGDRGDSEPNDSKRVTVLTKLYKDYDDQGNYRVMAVRVTGKTFVRKPWDLKLRNYPIAKFCWERRRSCAYGDSEITYMIPNQIAINRELTASVWAMMALGMPKMIVNGDTVLEAITNDPGQIIRVLGSNEDIAGAIHYVTPPSFGAQQNNMINDLANNTLADNGANDAALGNIRPDNAAAIIQIREAALAPMQMYQNRFYDFIEDIARIWADFWINLYGNRAIKIKDKTGTWYLAFHAERYRNLFLTANIDVGASTLWSESVVATTLGNLLTSGTITFDQYLERIPQGMIPDAEGLKEDYRNRMQQQPSGDISDDELIGMLKKQYPQEYQKLMRFPKAQRGQMLNSIREQLTQQTEQPQQNANVQEVGDL